MLTFASLRGHTLASPGRARVGRAALLIALAGCGGGKDSTAPRPLPPSLTAVNGVTRPTGLVGMTIMIDGTNLGDAAHGQVLFTPAAGGAAVQATITNPTTDWSSSFVVTTVPSGVAADSKITVQTAGGVSNAVPFSLVSGSTFSPSTIAWTRTTDLPMPLQGSGAAYVLVSHGGSSTSCVFVVGGADSLNKATTVTYRAQPQASGALGTWTAASALPQPRAYAAVTAATTFTAALDTTTTAGYLYAIGGVDATSATVSSVSVAKVGLDGSLGAWQATTALPVALHSASATVVRGYVYVVGGSTATNAPVATVYRALVHSDGTLGSWQAMAPLPNATSYLSLVQFGPYLYAIGGDNGTTTPVLNTATGTETSSVFGATLDLRDGTLTPAGWTTLGAMGKSRSKHSALAAGGALLVSSGVYGGSPGSSENTYATLNPDGTLGSWQGANGTNTIAGVLGYSLYNEASVFFTDASGTGHVMLIGGADRAVTGKASAAVVFY